MKKTIISISIHLIISLFLFSSCSLENHPKTDNERVSELLLEYAKKNVPDYNSFEIVELSNLDSAYTEIFKEDFIHQRAILYNEIINNIKSSQNEIRKLDNYISDIQSKIDDCWSDYGLKCSIVIGKTMNGWNRYWTQETSEGRAYVSNILNTIGKLGEKGGKAQAKKKEEEKRLKESIKQKRTIENEIKTYSTNWEKQYIGKSVQAKCRLKNEEGNMCILVYDVLCNDSLSNIISVIDTIERHSFNEIEKFIIHCNEQQ